MNCPACTSDRVIVKDSRHRQDGGAIRRRRLCEACDARFTTFEMVMPDAAVMILPGGEVLTTGTEIASRIHGGPGGHLGPLAALLPTLGMMTAADLRTLAAVAQRFVDATSADEHQEAA